MTAAAKTTLCAALAVAAFAAAYLAARLTAAAAGAVAVAVLTAGWIAIPRRPDAVEIEVAPGITQAQLDTVLDHIRDAAATFERVGQTIQDPRVNAAVQGLTRGSRSIADDLAQDPGSLREAWDFIDYHLGQAARIVDGYARLERAPDKSDEEARRLAEVGQAIVETEALFTRQLRALRVNDFAKLNEAVTAMKTIALRVDTSALPARTGQER